MTEMKSGQFEQNILNCLYFLSLSQLNGKGNILSLSWDMKKLQNNYDNYWIHNLSLLIENWDAYLKRQKLHPLNNNEVIFYSFKPHV